MSMANELGKIMIKNRDITCENRDLINRVIEKYNKLQDRVFLLEKIVKQLLLDKES